MVAGHVVHKVAAVKLHAGTVGKHIHGNACNRRIHGCRMFAAQAEVVIEAACDFQLFVVGVDVLTDCLTTAEIERRTFHTCNAGRNKILFYRRVLVGINLHYVTQYVAVAFAVKIEVRVVCRAEHSILVTMRHVFDCKASANHRVFDGQFQIARVAFFTVGAFACKSNAVACGV